LKSEIITVPPILLAPSNICVSADKLISLSVKKDTVFDFFQLPILIICLAPAHTEEVPMIFLLTLIINFFIQRKMVSALFQIRVY
jgi:hypothetical protein